MRQAAADPGRSPSDAATANPGSKAPTAPDGHGASGSGAASLRGAAPQHGAKLGRHRLRGEEVEHPLLLAGRLG